jgi:hypothetical protein
MTRRALLALVLALAAAAPARGESAMDPLDDRGRVVSSTPGYHDGPSSTVKERLDQLRSLSTARCMSGWVLERRSTGLVCVEVRPR